MKLTELKAHLCARRATLERDLQQRQQAVVLIEADLIKARRDADLTHGSLLTTDHDLAAVEATLQAASPPLAPPAAEKPVAAPLHPTGTKPA